jgi:hypothetical protein
MVWFMSSSKASHQGAHDFDIFSVCTQGWLGREATTSPEKETVVQNAKEITERQSETVIALYANEDSADSYAVTRPILSRNRNNNNTFFFQ